MKEINEDKLKGMFEKMPLRDPSSSFEQRLMMSIGMEAKKKQKKLKIRNIIYTSLSIGAAIAAIVVIPLIIFQIMGWSFDIQPPQIEMPKIEIPQLQFPKLKIQSIEANSYILVLGAAILLLVIGDLLIRKYIMNKKHKQ